jgi:hypothetical protein
LEILKTIFINLLILCSYIFAFPKAIIDVLKQQITYFTYFAIILTLLVNIYQIFKLKNKIVKMDNFLNESDICSNKLNTFFSISSNEK